MKKIGIIGMGKVGKAIGLRAKKDFNIYEFDKNKSLKKISEVDIVVLSIKPQDFYSLSINLKQYLSSQPIISVMAGINTGHISKSLASSEIIRTMPNLALRFGKSLTAVYSVRKLGPQVLNLISGWGEIIFLRDEAQFHSFTALSGSGPAYFLELANEIESIAIKSGFDKNIAKKISHNALSSALLLLEKNKFDVQKSVSEIKSKGGVTERALTTFNENKFYEILEKAVNDAINRSKELSK